MTFSVQMPALGESVTEGTVTRWLKREGDPVEADEPLLEVSTDKVDTEIPSPVSGNLARIVVREDETVRVGAEIAVISESTDADVSPAPSEPAPRHSEPEPATAETSPSDRSPTSGDRVSVTMPALGESVTEGTVTRWLKGVGDHVETDEPLLEVSTDKVDTEIPSPASGTILEIIAAEDSTVPVGGELAVIGDKTVDHAAPWQPNQPQQSWQEPTPSVTRTASPTWNAPAPPLTDRHPAPDAWQPGPRPQVEPLPSVEAPVAESARPAPAVPPPPAQAAPSSAVAPPKADETSPYVTPLVRKLASEHGIDLSAVAGTGVGGRIRKQDVLAAIEEASQVETPPPVETPVAPAPISVGPAVEKPPLRGTTEKMPRLRQIVAQRTRESLLVSAQLTQVVEVDVTKIAKLRARAKAEFQRREGVKLTFLPFFARAVVEALKQHPKLNASINEETREITYHGSEHLGIAVDTERGLLTPVIHNAGDLNLAGLAHKIVDVADRTRNNKITPDELSGGTFTVTNLGSNGALFDTPIIVQPQVGILGIGMVVKRPVVATDENGDDTIAIRSMVFLPLTYDHRLVDGADAGRFLTTVKQRLEEGSFEAELGL